MKYFNTSKNMDKAHQHTSNNKDAFKGSSDVPQEIEFMSKRNPKVNVTLTFTENKDESKIATDNLERILKSLFLKEIIEKSGHTK